MEKQKSDKFSINNIHRHKEKRKAYRYAREELKKTESQNFKKTNYNREINSSNYCSCCFWTRHYDRSDKKMDFYNEVKRVFEKKPFTN